jgi:hypothetical protein
MTEHESGVLTNERPPQVTPGAAVALHLPAELLRVVAGEPIAAPLAAVDGGGNVASAAPAAR